jgi:hypothetical protein
MKRIILCVLVLFSSACASAGLSAKQNAVTGLQASNVSLTSAQTLERQLCFNDPVREAGTHCTNPVAAQLKLSDATHVKMATFFNDAFGMEILAVPALQAWQSGSPAPSSVSQYITDINALLGVAQGLDPAASTLISQIQQAVTAVGPIAAALGIK